MAILVLRSHVKGQTSPRSLFRGETRSERACFDGAGSSPPETEAELSPRIYALRRKHGSYNGDPLQPNLDPIVPDPVHHHPRSVPQAYPQSTRVKKRKRTFSRSKEKSDECLATPPMEDMSQETQEPFQVRLPVVEATQFKLDGPSLQTRRLRWVHLSCKGSSPSDRLYHDSTVVNDALYITGGTNGESVMNQIYKLDLSKTPFSRFAF